MRKVLKEHFGCEVIGIERDAEAAEQAKRFCKCVIVKDCETMNYKEEFRSETFDVTIFADILEHLVNPQAVLEGVWGAPLLEVLSGLVVMRLCLSLISRMSPLFLNS